jgi:hypothetical protein
MLNEQRGRSCVYDASHRAARIEVRAGGGAVRDTSGTVLLDADGRVVGVDVEPDAPSRTVIMLGAHETVARTVTVRVSVARDAHGEIASVVVHGVDAPR